MTVLTYDLVADHILDYFRDLWVASAYAAVPLFFANQPGAPVTSSTWVRISIKFNTSSQVTLGSSSNRVFRRLGLFFVEVYTPLNSFTYSNNACCEYIAGLFDGVQLSTGELFQNVSVETVGVEYETSSFHQNVKGEFQFDVQK